MLPVGTIVSLLRVLTLSKQHLIVGYQSITYDSPSNGEINSHRHVGATLVVAQPRTLRIPHRLCRGVPLR